MKLEAGGKGGQLVFGTFGIFDENLYKFFLHKKLGEFWGVLKIGIFLHFLSKICIF